MSIQVVQHSQRFLEEETEDGYKPCDPSIIVERVQTLEGAYEELVRLAVERRSRLEESRQLWQFYWDMAEEENWIKEMEQILSQGDIGHDLTTIHLLLSKHKSLEPEIRAHENTLRQSMAAGQELIDQVSVYKPFSSSLLTSRTNKLESLAVFQTSLIFADKIWDLFHENFLRP